MNSFGIHLDFVVSENFAEDNGVIEVPVIEVYIRQEGS